MIDDKNPGLPPYGRKTRTTDYFLAAMLIVLGVINLESSCHSFWMFIIVLGCIGIVCYVAIDIYWYQKERNDKKS